LLGGLRWGTVVVWVVVVVVVSVFVSLFSESVLAHDLHDWGGFLHQFLLKRVELGLLVLLNLPDLEDFPLELVDLVIKLFSVLSSGDSLGLNSCGCVGGVPGSLDFLNLSLLLGWSSKDWGGWSWGSEMSKGSIGSI